MVTNTSQSLSLFFSNHILYGLLQNIHCSKVFDFFAKFLDPSDFFFLFNEIHMEVVWKYLELTDFFNDLVKICLDPLNNFDLNKFTSNYKKIETRNAITALKVFERRYKHSSLKYFLKKNVEKKEFSLEITEEIRKVSNDIDRIEGNIFSSIKIQPMPEMRLGQFKRKSITKSGTLVFGSNLRAIGSSLPLKPQPNQSSVIISIPGTQKKSQYGRTLKKQRSNTITLPKVVEEEQSDEAIQYFPKYKVIYTNKLKRQSEEAQNQNEPRRSPSPRKNKKTNSIVANISEAPVSISKSKTFKKQITSGTFDPIQEEHKNTGNLPRLSNKRKEGDHISQFQIASNDKSPDFFFNESSNNSEVNLGKSLAGSSSSIVSESPGRMGASSSSGPNFGDSFSSRQPQSNRTVLITRKMAKPAVEFKPMTQYSVYPRETFKYMDLEAEFGNALRKIPIGSDGEKTALRIMEMIKYCINGGMQVDGNDRIRESLGLPKGKTTKFWDAMLRNRCVFFDFLFKHYLWKINQAFEATNKETSGFVSGEIVNFLLKNSKKNNGISFFAVSINQCCLDNLPLLNLLILKIYEKSDRPQPKPKESISPLKKKPQVQETPKIEEEVKPIEPPKKIGPVRLLLIETLILILQREWLGKSHLVFKDFPDITLDIFISWFATYSYCFLQNFF